MANIVFFVLPSSWIFLFLEDLSVDTKQMTVDNLFDVVNKSKVTAKPADGVRKKRNMNTVGRRMLRKNLNLLLILVVKSKNNQEYCLKLCRSVILISNHAHQKQFL